MNKHITNKSVRIRPNTISAKEARETEELFHNNIGVLFAKAKNTPDELAELSAKMTGYHIPCQKYNYTVNGGPVLFDSYKAVLQLSEDRERLIIDLFKPVDN